MELDMATAVQTPLPLPDMSSPSSNFVYFSFISSISEKEDKPSRTRKHHKEHQLNKLPSVTFLLHWFLINNLLHFLHAQPAHRRREAWRCYCLWRCCAARAMAAHLWWWYMILLLVSTVGERGNTEQRACVLPVIAVAVESWEPWTVAHCCSWPCCSSKPGSDDLEERWTGREWRKKGQEQEGVYVVLLVIWVSELHGATIMHSLVACLDTEGVSRVLSIWHVSRLAPQ